jgi:hypothetical protein
MAISKKTNQETLMEWQHLSSIDTFAFTDDRGQRFRLVQTGCRRGRLLVRLEQFGADAPGSERWQAIAESLHISLAIRSARRPEPIRLQRLPTSRCAGVHRIRVTDYLRSRLRALTPRLPHRAQDLFRPAYIPLICLK